MAADASGLVAIGVSHHTAPVSIRERLALDEEGVRAELAYLRDSGLAREALVLSTCNRVELYAVPRPGEAERLGDHVARRRAGGAGAEPVDRYLFHLQGREAVRHLFRVACSLDSLVIGEPQILGQVKDAVRVAAEAHSLGTVLNRLTQRGLWLAKHVRTHTAIGRFHVGIGNAGVALAQQIFSTLRGRRALLVGVGEMGRQVARAMLNHGLDELVVANRTFARAVELAEEHGGTPVAFERVPEYLGRVDIVITATAATRPILSPADVRAALRQRRNRPLFLVDLAVPRNVDPEVDKLDQAYLFNVDDLTAVMERSRQAREEASREAERLVEAETDRFVQRLAVLEVNPDLGDVARWAERLRLDELHRSHRLVDPLDPAQREQLDAMTRALVKKLLHGPLRSIREAAREGDDQRVQWLLHALREGRDE